MLTTAGFALAAMSAKLGKDISRLTDEVVVEGAAGAGGGAFVAGFSSLFDPQGNQSAAKAT
jgi:hypothetical protein